MAASSKQRKVTSKAKPIRVASSTPGKKNGTSLDRLIHERSRLAIVSALAANKVLSFNELKALLEISDGNLSTHARKLEDAGYISCKKGFDGRMPRTQYALSASGRKALKNYVSHMETIIKAVKNI